MSEKFNFIGYGIIIGLNMLPDYVKLKDIKPALSGYIKESYEMLDSPRLPEEKTVHDIRVLMKKSRAVIKLLKSQVEEDTFNREYTVFREVGRLMVVWRETSVHRKLLKDLKKKRPDIFLQLGENERVNILLRKPESASETSEEQKAFVENIREILYKSGYRLRFQRMIDLDPHLLLKELELTYVKVSECFMTARHLLKPENLHEFRKRTKDFLYQLYFFRSLRPKTVKDLEKKLDTMAQNLGKYNDLTVLIKTIGYKYKGPGENSSALDELALIIRNEQDRYLSKVWPDACRIFCPGQKLLNLLGFKLLVI